MKNGGAMIAEAIMCLALNAYWEARNQSHKGMIGVSQVVMNRVESEYFPNTVCEVVKQGPTRQSWKDPEVRIPVKNRCQFSWYCDGKSDEVPKIDEEVWEEAKLIAFGVYNNRIDPLVGNSLWYHADYIRPAWAKQKKRVAKIDNHYFYEWKYKPKKKKK